MLVRLFYLPINLNIISLVYSSEYFVPILSLGALLVSFVNYLAIHNFLKNKLLEVYRNYLFFCILYALSKVVIYYYFPTDRTIILLSDIFLWLGYIFYIQFIFTAIKLDEEYENQKILPYISNGMIAIITVIIPIAIYIQIAFPQHTIWAIILVSILIGLFFLTSIFVVFLLFRKFALSKERYFRFIIWGCLVLIVTSIMGFLSEIFDFTLFGMQKISFNCLAFILELFFFNHAVNLNIKKGQEEYVKYKQIIQKIKLEKQNENLEQKIVAEQHPAAERVTEDKEKEILDKLNKFEHSEKFLKHNVTLSSLSDNLNTNPTYLSTIINKHKSGNFNAYINDLRINYIIQKIQLDPDFRKYKITYIAELCGFSSYTTFNKAFKNSTGISPSKFIEFSQKEAN